MKPGLRFRPLFGALFACSLLTMTASTALANEQGDAASKLAAAVEAVCKPALDEIKATRKADRLKFANALKKSFGRQHKTIKSVFPALSAKELEVFKKYKDLYSALEGKPALQNELMSSLEKSTMFENIFKNVSSFVGADCSLIKWVDLDAEFRANMFDDLDKPQAPEITQSTKPGLYNDGKGSLADRFYNNHNRLFANEGYLEERWTKSFGCYTTQGDRLEELDHWAQAVPIIPNEVRRNSIVFNFPESGSISLMACTYRNQREVISRQFFGQKGTETSGQKPNGYSCSSIDLTESAIQNKPIILGNTVWNAVLHPFLQGARPDYMDDFDDYIFMHISSRAEECSDWYRAELEKKKQAATPAPETLIETPVQTPAVEVVAEPQPQPEPQIENIEAVETK